MSDYDLHLNYIIARDVIRTLEQRAGFDEWWGLLDEELQQEVITALAESINYYVDDV